MFGKRYHLLTAFGIPIRFDLSWLVVAGLVSWSLAANFFPSSYAGFPEQVYWLMGLAGALGLFASVVVHELAHALTARQFGLSIRGITLFIFGGVAEMDTEPPSPKAEFVVAIAGPVASVLLAFSCFAAGTVATLGGWSITVGGVLSYLAFINLILATFNMIPAFPLDGGRVLRSLLWQWRKNLRWATSITSKIGTGFGVVLIALGIYELLVRRDLIGGLWFFMIGMFLRNAARSSYRQLVMRRSLEGEPVRRFLHHDPVAVPRSISVADLVEGYIYRYQHQMYPVVDGDRLLGCVGTQQVKALSPEEWPRHSVGAIAVPCTEENTTGPERPALEALAKMSRSGAARLLVVERDRLLGVVELKDLLRFLALKAELEEPEAARGGSA